jgi:hypothetical protein
MKELKSFRRDERMPVQNLGSPYVLTAPAGLITHHTSLWEKYFLPNEPKVVQCLPGKLKK